MLISIVSKINSFNEWMFAPIDGLVEKLPLADWILDGICDSIHMLPFLFFIFLVIELLEYFWADKLNSLLKRTGKRGILVGCLAAIIPQCGFSVMASSLYVRKIITRGSLISVYLATSDETIPILLAIPEKAHLILPIIGIKLVIAVIAGCLIDAVCPQKLEAENIDDTEQIEEGCCKHDIEHGHKREIILHPVVHTFNVFWFILVITLILNYCFENISVTSLILHCGKFVQPIASSIIGLIPNCAVSIGFTMMLVKGSITLSSTISGLLSNAGLGLLVLLKNNDFKDTIKVISILLSISIFSGIILTLVM